MSGFFISSQYNQIMPNDKIVSRKLRLEFYRRSTPGAIGFLASTIPLYFYPLITGPEQVFYNYLLILIILINISRIYFSRVPKNFDGDIPRQQHFIHSLMVTLNSICYGLLIGMCFYLQPIASNGFIISIILLSGITAASTTSLVLDRFLQNTFFVFAAIVPVVELFILAYSQQNKAYGTLASLLVVFILYLFVHSRQYYYKMCQLFKYESQILDEKYHLELVVEDLKKAQTEILKQKARANQAAHLAAIGEVAAGIAHEINNPLTIIQGNIKQIHQIAERESAIQIIDRSIKIENSINRISRIISGLKWTSSSKPSSVGEKVLFKNIVDRTLENYVERLDKISLQVSKCPEVELHLEELQIIQVLSHLLDNAISALQSTINPTIKIDLQTDEQFLIIKIQDNGPGIPLEARTNIFVPFYTTKEIGQGTGLGLSIARGIIEHHGGTLTLNDDQAQNGNWTTFKILLPIHQSPTA